jgi:hypothetical protein
VGRCPTLSDRRGQTSSSVHRAARQPFRGCRSSRAAGSGYCAVDANSGGALPTGGRQYLSPMMGPSGGVVDHAELAE